MRRVVDLLDVLAVDLDRVHVVGERALRHVVPDRRVLPARRRLGPLVVLADEHRLRLPELREVERLVEGAGVRRAVAEERDRDPRLVAQLEREPGADERRQAAADDRVRAEVAALDVVEVHRAAVAVRAALDLPVELGHQRVRVRAARERVPVRAMGGAEDVAVLHRRADADLGRLLADRDVQEARAARRRGSAPRPSPRSGGSGASRAGSRAASPRTARVSSRPWPQLRQCTVLPVSVAAAVESHWIRASGDLGARVASSRIARSRGGRPGRSNTGADRPVPRLADDLAVLGRPRRQRSRTPRHHKTSRAHREGHAFALEFAGCGQAGRARSDLARRVVGRRARRFALRLERPVRRGRVHLERPHRARRGALHPDEPAPRRRRARRSTSAPHASPATASRPAWRAAASSAATSRA